MKKIFFTLQSFLLIMGFVNAQTNTFPSSGNVGIGTDSPLDKLTVKGHVNIGDDGNYRLRVRHIDGKSHLSRDLGTLYLNHNTNKNVLVGFGPTNPQSNLYLSGRLGMGFTGPTHHIDVRNDIDPIEAFLRFRVQDAPSDFFQITNATGSNGQFIPVVKGTHVSDNRCSIQFMGVANTGNDNGSNAVVNFDARYNDGPIQTRPLFVWTSYTDKKMTMLANGNLGIGTTVPDAKLAVKGQIHAQEVKVDLNGAIAPDYVFKEDYELKTLEEVQKHIDEHGHLPNIPSAAEMEEKGLLLKEMNLKLLEKIEELTLYVIHQQKEIEKLKNQIKL